VKSSAPASLLLERLGRNLETRAAAATPILLLPSPPSAHIIGQSSLAAGGGGFFFLQPTEAVAIAGRRLGDAADGPVCGRGEALSAANADAEEGKAEESGSTAWEALSRGSARGLDLGPHRA
jgi:hypothetical protein